MKRRDLEFLGLIFGTLLCASVAAEKPILYNYVREELTDLDRDVKKAYEPKYNVVEIRSSPEYQPPKRTVGKALRVARTTDGKQLDGNVLMAYVVTADGRAADPIVFKTSDERLIDIAIGAIDDWRFTPGTLNGEAVAAASQPFAECARCSRDRPSACR